MGNLRVWENLFSKFTQVQNELQEFFPIVPQYLCILEEIDSCAKVSDNWENLLGWQPEVLESRPWIQWMDSSSIVLWRDRLQSLHCQPKLGKISTFETYFRNLDKSWQQLSWRISLGRDQRFYAVAQPIGTLPDRMDCLEYESPVDSLKWVDREAESTDQDRWRSLIEHSSTLICIQDVNAQILYISPSVEDILGYQPKNLLGRQSWDFIHSQDIAQVRSKFEQLLKTPNQTVAIEYRFHHQNGCWRFLHCTVKNLLNDPSIKGIVTNSYDITTLKKAEIIWQKLNEELEQRVGLQNGDLHKANQLLKAEILEREQAQAELQAAEEQWRHMINKVADAVLIINAQGIIFFANYAAEVLFGIKQESLINMPFGIPNSENEICEIYLPQMNGSYVTVEMRIEKIDWQGKPAYLASLRDIRDREKAESRLRESEERYRTLAESAQDLIFILNCDRTLAYINSFGSQLLGIEQGINSDAEKISNISIVNKFKFLENSIKEVFKLDASIRLEDQLLYQGSKLWLDTLLVPLRDEFGQIYSIFGVARDITKLKWIEQSLRQTQGQLRQREKLLRLTLEQAPIGIVTCDLSGKFLHFNPAFCQILGYSARNLKQMAWIHITDKNDLEIQESYSQKLLQGDLRNFQLENCYQRQDGTKIQGIIRVALIRDSQGNPLHYVAQLEDVTERKQAEAKIKASLKEKEVLIKEVHHRVKNNLQIVSSLLDLQTEYIHDPEILEKLEDSKHRLLAMSLIHETLYQSENLAQVDLSDYVERLATNILFAESTDYDRIHLDFDLEPVFLNLETAIPCGLLLNELITNSIKHAFPAPIKGKISIELHYQSPHSTSEINQTGCQTDKIMLRVSDNGVGFPKNIDLTETKSLGLTLIQDLTQQLRGDLQISSIKGTQFSLFFSELKYRARI